MLFSCPTAVHTLYPPRMISVASAAINKQVILNTNQSPGQLSLLYFGLTSYLMQTSMGYSTIIWNSIVQHWTERLPQIKKKKMFFLHSVLESGTIIHSSFKLET